MVTSSSLAALRQSPNFRWWALGALSLAMLTIGLDTTILSVAVPTLATALHASTSQLQWFSTAYTLVLAAVLLPAGMLGDRFGRKRLLVGALVLFGAASVWCAYAGSANDLIAARALLGLAAAFMMPLSMAVLPVLFPDTAQRARAITIWVTCTALGLPLGPIVGGWLLDRFWWGSVFLINVPFIMVGVIVVGLLVPESRSTLRSAPDLLGVALSTAGLVGLTYGLIAAGADGWGDTTALTALGAGAVLLGAFVGWQRRARHPLVNLALFSNRAFTSGTALATLVTFALIGLLFVLPQYFQAVTGTSPLGTGLRLLPMIGGLVVGTRLADRVAARIGRPAGLAVGFAALIVGLLACTTIGVDSGYGLIAVWIALIGAGVGFVLPASMAVALNALTLEASGAGSALIQALRQVGSTIGVAVLGTILNAGYHAQLSRAHVPPAIAGEVRDSVGSGMAAAARLDVPGLRSSVQSAFTHGMHQTFFACACVAAVGLVLSLALLPRRSHPAADERAESSHDVVHH